jgi:hypothetical protein
MDKTSALLKIGSGGGTLIGVLMTIDNIVSEGPLTLRTLAWGVYTGIMATAYVLESHVTRDLSKIKSTQQSQPITSYQTSTSKK